jgi:DNA ligase-1
VLRQRSSTDRAERNPTTDSDLQHACDWDRIKDLTGWLLAEKMDGCRAFWDGSQFWTRGGNIIEAPARIANRMPGNARDGEMWAGRGGFKRASNAVRFGGDWWDGVDFFAFDAPEVGGDVMTRWNEMRLCRDNLPPICVCESNAHALDLMRQIQADGGEGLVARKPDLVWRPGRTTDMLKLK